MNIDDDKIKKVVLERIKVKLAQYFSPAVLQTLTIEQFAELFADQIEFQITMQILGQNNFQEYSALFYCPKNWWQFLRKTVLPKWWIQRFPIKQMGHRHTVTFNHMALLPKLNHVFPEKQEIIMYSYPTSPNVTPNNE